MTLDSVTVQYWRVELSNQAIQLSDASLRVAGILLLAIVTIESGGAFMLAIVRGTVDKTDFQKSFARAGHAHSPSGRG